MEVVIRCQLLQPFVSLLGDMNTTGGSIMTDDIGLGQPCISLKIAHKIAQKNTLFSN